MLPLLPLLPLPLPLPLSPALPPLPLHLSLSWPLLLLPLSCKKILGFNGYHPFSMSQSGLVIPLYLQIEKNAHCLKKNKKQKEK
jgi:hypothetical protein